MATPFHSPATSPPAPAHSTIPNPRKRPSLPSASTTQSVKRRKASTYSAASSKHPLRQTSFPPESAIQDGPRSPSVESDATASRSVAASGVGGKAGQRGRKRKSVAPSAAGDGASVRSGRTGEGGGGSVAARKRGDTASRAEGQDGAEEPEEDAEGEPENEGDEDVGLVEGRRQGADEERRRYAVLFEAADEEQQERMVAYKRYHLSDAKLRRIVNQTLSQSVPKSVITAINSYAKVFVGELIERAMEVQREEALAARSYLAPEELDGVEGTRIEVKGESGRNFNGEDGQKEEYIGPLLPDSLREALRRHKRDGEAGGVGMEGISLGMGVQGAKAASLGGRRLFR